MKILLKTFFLAFLILPFFYFYTDDMFAGNTCVYVSLNRYVCGAWDVCGTGASCGAICTSGTPGVANCGNGSCTYQCTSNENNCLSGGKYIDFIAPGETKNWESWNGDMGVDSTGKIPVSYTGPNDKLTFIASAHRKVGISGGGLGGIKVTNITTGRTYTQTTGIKRLPCSSIFNASNRYDLGDLSGNGACRRYEGWVGCFYGMERYFDWSVQDTEENPTNGPWGAERTCGWHAQSGPPWLDEINDFQIDKSDLTSGVNEFEVSILGEDKVGSCQTQSFSYTYDPDNTPPTKPGDPIIPACIAVAGGTYQIRFSGSTDLGSGLSHYVVNVDEGNNNLSNFASVCSNSLNSGDSCISGMSNIINYTFRDNQIYRIWIDAFDNAGNKNTSNEVIYSPKTPPPAPTNVGATDGLDSQVNIDWDDNSNFTYNTEDRFDVIRDSSVIHPIPTSNVTRNATSYSDTSVVCDGTVHSYNVKAVNSCGESLGSPNAGHCISVSDNAWWQVFNGGVHSNGGINIDEIPVNESIIGNGLSTDNPLVLGESISTYNGYGLMSSMSDIDITSGTSGISGHDYFAQYNNLEMVNPANATTFNRIQTSTSWTEKHSSGISSMGNVATNTYYVVPSSATVNSVISYTSNKVVAVIFNPSSATLYFRKNIVDNSPDKDKFLVIFVDGNVSIDSTVSKVDAFIIASGTITVESAGMNLDDPILIKGGLYANQIFLNRDLKNVPANNNKPAEYISYNQKLILNQGDVPFEIKETPIQWVLDE